jgi:pimeloyl-ACP methyl ester carboxylesterase
MVQSLLADKYAVALTDYEGFGASGSHPYLEPRTATFNTIDAVRAMRAISPTVSTRWMAVGYSQGGQAVWAADELNSYYGNDLQLQGTVALAPRRESYGRGRPRLVRFVDRRSTGAFPDGLNRRRSVQPRSRRRRVSARGQQTISEST